MDFYNISSGAVKCKVFINTEEILRIYEVPYEYYFPAFFVESLNLDL
jgi:hypothetical protein